MVMNSELFQPTLPLGEPELMRASAYQRYLPDEWNAELVGGTGTALLFEPGKIEWLGGIKAGDVVLAGSFTRPTGAARGDTLHADYGPLGTVSFRFGSSQRAGAT